MMKQISLLALSAGAVVMAAACTSPSKEGGPSAAGAAKTAAPTAVSANLEQGKALYKINCASCHGESGKGDGPAAGVLKPPPRDHTDSAYMSTLSDDEIFRVIKMGGALKGKPLMPSHPQFKDPELRALVAYVRSLSTPAQ
jgi:mono/diheme cytochrome c family protein